MHGLDACDLCFRQVPSGFTRAKLWRLGWEWSTFVTFAVGGLYGFQAMGVPFMAPKPVRMRTRWVCAACWPWELLLVETIRTTEHSAKSAMYMVRRMRKLRLTVEQGRVLFSEPNTFWLLDALEQEAWRKAAKAAADDIPITINYPISRA